MRRLSSLKWAALCVGTLAVSSFLYAFGVGSVTGFSQDLITVVFLVFLLAFVAWLALDMRSGVDSSRTGWWIGILMVFALTMQMSIGVGFTLSGQAVANLWVPDSQTTHLPGAIGVAKALSGEGPWPQSPMILGTLVLTHFWVGFWIYLFGVSPLVTVFALGLLKSLTCAVVFKLGQTLFDVRAAMLAALIYMVAPTVIFYSATYYKEASIQLLLAVVVLSCHRLVLQNRARAALVLVPSLALLMGERFYLVPPFLALILFYILINTKWSLKLRVGIGCVLAVGCAIVYLKLSPYFPLELLIDSLGKYRRNYNAYPDISPINTTLPYPLAALKLAFSPYPTLRNYGLFKGFSSLLFWGGLINQGIILLAFIGSFRALSTKFKEHLLTWVPFFWFLALFAYLAPYSGRQRDSFYPVIAIYCATEIFRFLDRARNFDRPIAKSLDS